MESQGTSITKDFSSRYCSSAFIVLPFDNALRSLERERYDVISLEENAKLRIESSMQRNPNCFLERGNFVREGILYTPEGKLFFLKNSPIIENSSEATKASANGREYYPLPEQIEEILEDSIEMPKLYEIPTERFGEDPLTANLFGNSAQVYGEFLKEKGINEIPIWNANIFNGPFIRQIWFRMVDDGSGIYTGFRQLHHTYRLRGIKK